MLDNQLIVKFVVESDSSSAPTFKFLLDGRSLVFCWVPDGTTKYRRLTKDRGEAPERVR